MNYKFSIIIIFLICNALLFAGCIEEKTVLDFFVDDNYDSSVKGWQVDHFRSIQNAINAASNNSTITVNEGTYNENLEISKVLIIKGQNANNTIINGDGVGNNVVRITRKGQVILSGFTIQNSAQIGSIPEQESGLHISSDNNLIFNNIFQNNICGIVIEIAQNNTIENNLFTQNTYGIYLNILSNENILINNIIFENNFGLRMKSSKVNIIKNNIISSNNGGIYLCCASNNNTIFSNIFCDNSNWHVEDWCKNIWDDGIIGNYWDTYYQNSDGAFDNNSDNIIDESLLLIVGIGDSVVINEDRFPRIIQPNIQNPFLRKISISCYEK